MTLDLSTLTLTPEPYKLLNEFAGVTQSPASTELEPTGTAYTLTGQVPYNVDHSDNRISYTGNLNKFTEGGTTVEISYGTGNEKVVLLTDTAGTSGDIDIYDGWIIVDSAAIAAGTWNIVITDSDSNVVLSQTASVSGLTLEPVPAPRFSITNTTQTATLTTDGILNADGVDAILGGSLPVDENTIVTPGDAYPNRFNFTITTNNQGFFQAGDVIQISGGAANQPYLTGLKQDYPLTFNDGIGTANISLPIRPMNYQSATVLWDQSSSKTYFDITIIRPGPDYPTTSSDFTTIITRKVRYHHYLKFTPYRNIPPVQLSNITYEGTSYNSSDFVSGGTIEICSALQELGVIVKNMHFKWVNLQGTDNEYYLPLIATNTWMYRAFNAADTDGFMSGLFTGAFGSRYATRPAYTVSGYSAGYSGTTTEPTLTPILIGINSTAINNGYVSGSAGCKQKSSSESNIGNGTWYITFENCTFEEAPPNPYQVTGTGLNFDPTATYTVVDQGLSETVLGSDAVAGCTLDSTTAGTQADPWIANFTVKDLGASVATKWKVPFTINWDNTTLGMNGVMGIPTGWSYYEGSGGPPEPEAFFKTSGDFVPVSNYEWSIWFYDRSTNADVVKYVHTTLTLAT